MRIFPFNLSFLIGHILWLLLYHTFASITAGKLVSYLSYFLNFFRNYFAPRFNLQMNLKEGKYSGFVQTRFSLTFLRDKLRIERNFLCLRVMIVCVCEHLFRLVSTTYVLYKNFAYIVTPFRTLHCYFSLRTKGAISVNTFGRSHTSNISKFRKKP